jgi:endonuclease YncB( thermonuclease family)
VNRPSIRPSACLLAAPVLALAACAPPTPDLGAADAIPDEATFVEVVEVVDGDSLMLTVDGSPRDARLIGLNAPERDACHGSAATKALTELVGGRVSMTTDTEASDQYGRLLVYLWRADGTLVNAALARGGHAIAASFPPNTARQAEIDAAGAEAEDAGAGLWSACASTEAAAIVLDGLAPDPPGPDTDALVDEWVAFTNPGDAAVDLSGWVLRDASTANRYRFPPGTILEPGARVRVRTGCGTDTATELHWCAPGPVWNNTGDEVIVLDQTGRTVLATTYGS